ncbi:hypothetical protein BGX31_009292 [Mortierella sp. GBA43]|nr:hypothetical protein BGX31_009292 [Mortierella sp. GBA43]
MNTEAYMDPPHFRHTGRGTSTGTATATAAAGARGTLNSAGYDDDDGEAVQALSGFATPQSSPQSQSSSHQRRGHGPSATTGGGGAGSYYGSGSEEDHDSPPLLSDLSPFRGGSSSVSGGGGVVSGGGGGGSTRRDSGQPIKMTAAKRLPPPFHHAHHQHGTSISSIPQEFEGDEYQQQQQHYQQQPGRMMMEDRQRNRHDYHEDEMIESVPHDDDDQQEDVQMLDRDMQPRQVNNLPRAAAIHGGSKPSLSLVDQHRSSFHPFPSPPTRAVPTSVSTSVKSSPLVSATATSSSQGNRTPQTARLSEPDRGPADLSNPSAALAEALIAARSKAEAKAKALQQQQQQSEAGSNGRKHSQLSDSLSPSSAVSGTQVRIPMPDLSPPLRGYHPHHTHTSRLQDLDHHRSGGGEGPYTRRTSFTLSPTSSNPELAESQSDSHSGSYGTPRPHTGAGRSKYINGGGNRPMGPSISSTISRYSDDLQQQHQQQQQQQPQQSQRHSQHLREASVLGTSYDSNNSAQQDAEVYSRFGFSGRDMQQSSKSLQKQRHQDHHKQSEPVSAANSAVAAAVAAAAAATVASRTNGYPPTTSSSSQQSLPLSEDLQDQLTTEAEYIMNRNTELLKILSIRDEEIQTLQQELDHTLKVMHEYEDDLMAMHTAEAKPYESYHQTLDQLGHEVTQQEAIVKGYQQENEKLTTQLKSSVELRQAAEKRHLQTVERLKTEVTQMRAELETSDQEKYGNADLRVLLKQAQESHERTRKNLKDKEEEHQAEMSDLKERLRLTEQLLQDERKGKAEDMQKLEREVQDFRTGYDGMLAQLRTLHPSYGGGMMSPLPSSPRQQQQQPQPHAKQESSSSSADDNIADTTVDMEMERDIESIRDSLLKDAGKASSTSSSNSSTSSTPLTESMLSKPPKHKLLDPKLTSTDTLATAHGGPDHGDADKTELERRLHKFEADVHQSLMRTASIESFISVRSSTGTAIPLAPSSKSQQQRHRNGSSREDVRLVAGQSEQQKLANKLRDRINALNVENKRLHKEISSLSLVLRQQQAERQRRVAQLEELLDMHENVAAQKMDDADTEEGQARIRKIIQGLMVRIRTKEAEAEFYHNAYLEKVLELDQMTVAQTKTSSSDHGGNSSSSEDAAAGAAAAAAAAAAGSPQVLVEGLAVGGGPGAATSLEGLEARIKELERSNMEASFRLAAEQRRAQASESENATLVRDKLMLARMLEDQMDQLQSKLSAVEIAKAKLQDENVALRQGSKDPQQSPGGQSDRSASPHHLGVPSQENGESMAIMRSRVVSLTRQRDQLKEQLQEAFDIQLAMQDRTGGGVPEWSVDDFKRLEKALEEKSSEMGVWKERAVALEKVVERIRMIKDKPEPTGLTVPMSAGSAGALEKSSSSARDTDSVISASSASGRSHHHTLEELDQVVLRLEQRLERRDQELQEVVLEAKRQADQRLETWKAKWVQVVQRKNAEIQRFQVELESLMAAVDRDRARMAASMKG